ncbi:MAG: xylulokinase, partial [Candidatus Omnitrophica bacterium]|nr:xylulokinase [Candidatus Omnitrophota bacterium]
TEEAATAPAGCEGLVFLPYLMGERTPYADPDAKGVFFGLTMRHSKSHLVRAVMEGVAFGMNDSLQLIRGLRIPVGEIRLSGGGGRSRLWRQIQADVYNHPVVTINIDEGPAFGAALLAGVGTGIYKSVKEACNATIEVAEEIAPIKENVKIYQEQYGLYQRLYPSLKEMF